MKTAKIALITLMFAVALKGIIYKIVALIMPTVRLDQSARELIGIAGLVLLVCLFFKLWAVIKCDVLPKIGFIGSLVCAFILLIICL